MVVGVCKASGTTITGGGGAAAVSGPLVTERGAGTDPSCASAGAHSIKPTTHAAANDRRRCRRFARKAAGATGEGMTGKYMAQSKTFN